MDPDPFSDLEAFQALPRLSGLLLSPDGTRLVTTVATLDAKRQRWVNAVWEVDPEGRIAPRRLTRSAKGEVAPAFTEDGDLLFTSARPVPDGDDEDPPRLWRLPARGGEAHVVGSRAGGVAGPKSAGGVIVVTSDTLPGSTDSADDALRRTARKERKVTAILHSGFPVRHWDHDLGPGAPRLLAARPSGEQEMDWTDLTPAPGRALDEAVYDVSPDGRYVVTSWAMNDPQAVRRSTLVVIDTATGERRVLADTKGYDFNQPKVSPDGARVAALRWTDSTASDPGIVELVLLAFSGEDLRVVQAWDRWPTALAWSHDGSAVLVTADEAGRGPVFRVCVDTLEVCRLTTDDGAYSDLCVARDGSALYALRSGYDGPPLPVRLDPETPGVPTRLPGPAADLALPGRLEEVRTTAADGRELRAWLALPPGDGPHPLLLWVHGGPLSSWNAWSWRWCPWLMVAQGYAVLLPDPALSTGYGLAHVRAGWGDWGGAPYQDLLRVTDAALERGDLDVDRTAAMGGSFGGYMANWIAGHTDRFRAIVTHASLWGLARFGATTDGAWLWSREMTAEMVARNDPSACVDHIVTPMLVVHGDQDYRVPVGEALSLWWDLCRRAPEPTAMPHRFLYFPDENHWVLSPGHAVIWYQFVIAFLDQHVRGAREVVPELLR